MPLACLANNHNHSEYGTTLCTGMQKGQFGCCGGFGGGGGRWEKGGVEPMGKQIRVISVPASMGYPRTTGTQKHSKSKWALLIEWVCSRWPDQDIT